jgi:class 3 adenylate cyclase/tetratricopeptide (TPR) repeat protein
VEAERRQVTVLFTDMVGFTTFSERSGEEAAFTLMRSLAALMDDAVRRQGGVVQGFTGDGIMAVFGAPVALEDAPLRACRAALAILQQLNAAGEDLESKYGVRPQLRIGLNAGAAVVGKVQGGADAAVTVLGDTVNVASRLQALAEPDSAVMSEAMQRLVQGMVETRFAGEHQIKGKAEPQKLYRLDSIRPGAVRFDAAVSRGLSVFVGRERELELLERSLDEARSELRVIDLAAEPGMGKSRLLYEFRQRIGTGAQFLTGSCSSDGQQTPFLPFIEVVRSAFGVSPGEAEADVARKLEMGLTTLGLNSRRNLGLLLHLLGLKVPDGALTGLDGVLIGLRTRELLQQLLESHCRLSPVVMVIEDLHWIDSVSEEVLGKFVDGESGLRLLILTTRRPEYAPPWLDRTAVTTLDLEPLRAGDIGSLVRSRLAIEVLPDALAQQVAEKAEGNPLFAEEIAGFLTERGVLRSADGKLDFDAGAVAGTLPASLQNLFTTRVDRLAPKDRTLLQAASVIGRRFDPHLLDVVIGQTNSDSRLAAMVVLDLVHGESKSGGYIFKHALVRDALYKSLLTETRTALHLKIAEEIERRSSNRFAEVAEVLAHHYGQTDRADKAFTYLAMAGGKSLAVYSLDEAQTHLSAAAALLDQSPDCATDDQVADFLVNYLLLLNLIHHLREMIPIVERYRARIDRLGDDRRAVLTLQQRVISLVWMGRYREAAAAQDEISAMADQLGDDLSTAYSAAGAILTSWTIWPPRVEHNQALSRTALAAASSTSDPFIQSWLRWVIALEALARGHPAEARSSAREMITIGQESNDPRSVGFGLSCLAWTENTLQNYQQALHYGEEALKVAVTHWDRMAATYAKAFALVMLRKPEGIAILDVVRQENRANGQLYPLGLLDLAYAFSLVLQGRIAEGIRWLKQIILETEKEGYRQRAEWFRILLCQVYLEIIEGNEKPPLAIVVQNLPTLIWVKVLGPSRVRAIMNRALPLFLTHSGPDSFYVASCEMILGLLDRTQRRRESALEHLTKANRILLQFGETPLLARVERSLAALGQ